MAATFKFDTEPVIVKAAGVEVEYDSGFKFKLSAHNEQQPVLMQVDSGLGKIDVPLSNADVFTLIDGLKLILAREAALRKYR